MGDLQPLRVCVPNLLASTELERTVNVHPAHEKNVRRYFGRVRRFAKTLGTIYVCDLD